jgi:biotin synthase-related radical SAM superfamily protein
LIRFYSNVGTVCSKLEQTFELESLSNAARKLQPAVIGMTQRIRASVGTAAVLGLQPAKLDAEPSTAYLMTYYDGKCVGNCSFCPQARLSSSKTDLLSRVTWPDFPLESVTSALAKSYRQGKVGRVCIQALNYPQVFADLPVIIKAIKQASNISISVSCQPINKQNIILLKESGVDRIGIALDAATEAIFCRVKGVEAGGCYSWQRQLQLLEVALSVFGRGNVSTHIILGLDETEKEAVEAIQWCADIGVLPALFAFTPVRGTAFETRKQPELAFYRRVQLARYLIVNGFIKSRQLSFGENGEIRDFGVPEQTLKAAVESSEPFQTSGCPNCNRPYYNEKPSGPIFNYPTKLSRKEIENIKADLGNQLVSGA